MCVVRCRVNSSMHQLEQWGDFLYPVVLVCFEIVRLILQSGGTHTVKEITRSIVDAI